MDQPEDGILEGKFKLHFSKTSCLPRPSPHCICDVVREVLAGVTSLRWMGWQPH